MADVLTQLQTCYDQLATQMFATLSYISSHHTYLPPNPTPSDRFSHTQPMEPTPEESDPDLTFRPMRPDSPTTFAAAQRELARDLILKEQQIEMLIEVLPGIGSNEQEQEERIRALEKELRGVEERRRKKRREVRKLLESVEQIVMEIAGTGGAGEGGRVNGHRSDEPA